MDSQQIDRDIVAALATVDIEGEAEQYEFRGDAGDYTPSATECFLLVDFASGLMNEVHAAVRPLVERHYSLGHSVPSDPTLAPEEILDNRLRAAGMMTVPEMMGVTPMTQWEVQRGMDSIEFFAKWLDRRAAEFLRMRLPYELGDKDKNDELYEWVVAHAASFHEVRVQLRAVLPALFPGVPDEASAS